SQQRQNRFFWRRLLTGLLFAALRHRDGITRLLRRGRGEDGVGNKVNAEDDENHAEKRANDVRELERINAPYGSLLHIPACYRAFYAGAGPAFGGAAKTQRKLGLLLERCNTYKAVCN